MRFVPAFVAASVLALALVGCTRDALTSPQELVLILETRINLAHQDATVAVRVRDLEANEALVHVECADGEDQTVVARYRDLTEEVCGVRFEMIEFRMRDSEPSAVILNMHFDDGTSSEVTSEEGESGEAASGEEAGSAPEASE